jgi:hypothetical protein
VVKECEQANERIYALSVADPEVKLPPQPLTSLTLSSLGSMGLSSKSGVDEVPAYSNLNSFDSRFIPPKGPLREEWAKYVQLGLCARWALDHVFIDGKKVKTYLFFHFKYYVLTRINTDYMSLESL